MFYPGANVEFTAYAPLAHALAADGWRVVLVHMPLNHAFFDIDAATNAMERNNDVERWFVGGHSLGGAMAAMYAAEHTSDIVGLVLCASFSTADLSDTELQVYSAYGSNDGVLNRDSYAKNWSNLPQIAIHELVIPGGNHAQFGSYGKQKGDNDATIAAQEQCAHVVSFLHAA